MPIVFADPGSGEPLELRNDAWVCPSTGEVLARVVDGIPRFVSPQENYAESFGWQWKHWAHARSDTRNPGYQLRETLSRRTRFAEYELAGKTLLECGMGGGDDTEVLLEMPFAEIHAFDLSSAVERAAKQLDDPRLVLSQASIYEIPYPDAAFDFVFCHRVLQHTPDPHEALRRVCAKVKPGGVLFAHSYKRSRRHMQEFRYKYRWLARHLPRTWVHAFLWACGPLLHRLKHAMNRWPRSRDLAYRWVPWYTMPPQGEGGELPRRQRIELEACTTFDALTPRHDHPMTTEEFVGVIEAEGFHIEHLHDAAVSPVYCTAVRRP